MKSHSEFNPSAPSPGVPDTRPELDGISDARPVLGELDSSAGSRRRGWYSHGSLPHYDADGLIQHVTFHLADSLPKAALERIDGELEFLADEKRKIERRKRIHQWIDAGYGCCILQHPLMAEMVQRAFLHFHGTRYALHAWVVMPNHVHVLFRPLGDWSLSKIVASWKKFTARRIRDFVREANRVDQEIDDPGVVVEQEIDDPRARLSALKALSPVWHRKYWDRFVRDENHYGATVDYIHRNPVSTGLVAVPTEWLWSSARYVSGEGLPIEPGP